MNIIFKKYIRPIIAILLILILAVVLIWFVIDFRSLYSSGAFRPTRPLYHRRSNANPSMLQPGQIQGWMNFRYLNFVFRLPANYLSGKLAITDPTYPNTTLDKYANTRKLNNAAFVESVRQAVAAYANGGNL